jgi:hypothetical protein
VVVLEALGFDVDPTTGTLKERPLLLYTTFLPSVKTLTKKAIQTQQVLRSP